MWAKHILNNMPNMCINNQQMERKAKAQIQDLPHDTMLNFHLI